MTIVFVIVFAGLLGAVHWYLWRRLVRDTTAKRSRYRRAGSVLIIAFPLTVLAMQVAGALGLPFWIQQLLGWVGYVWAALLIYLLMSLLVGEALRPLLRRWLTRRDAEAGDNTARTTSGDEPAAAPAVAGATTRGAATAPAADPRPAASGGEADPDRAADQAPSDPGRRLFLSRGIAAGAAVIAAGTVGYGLWNARQLRTVYATVPLVNLPAAADGYRITVMSDLHAGPVIGRSLTQQVATAMNRTEPDLMVIVGDLVDAGVDELRHALEPLADLRARDGVYYVTGNHEYYVGAEQWVEHVQELGMIPLRNQHVALDAGFDLAGLDDIAGEPVGRGPDWDATLDGRDTSRPVVVLAHQPELIDEAQRRDVDLMISGHTHGGQIWPGPIIAGWVNPTLAGLERYGDSQLYVTRGAGAWGPPVRVGADPDISVLTLTPAS